MGGRSIAYFSCHTLPFISRFDSTDFCFVERAIPRADVSDDGIRESDAHRFDVVRGRVQNRVFVLAFVDMVAVVPANHAVAWFVDQFWMCWCDSGVHNYGLVGWVHVGSGACSLPGRWVICEVKWWCRVCVWWDILNAIFNVTEDTGDGWNLTCLCVVVACHELP